MPIQLYVLESPMWVQRIQELVVCEYCQGQVGIIKPLL